MTKRFLQQMKERINQNVHLIWEDMEVPYTWTRLMQRINGLSTYFYEEFFQNIEERFMVEIQLLLVLIPLIILCHGTSPLQSIVIDTRSIHRQVVITEG